MLLLQDSTLEFTLFFFIHQYDDIHVFSVPPSAPAVIPPGETPETEVEEDDFKYFQVECGRFTDFVIIEQIDIVGHCAVYVSITVVNPGPINPTAVTYRNESANVNQRRIIVRVQSRRVS